MFNPNQDRRIFERFKVPFPAEAKRPWEFWGLQIILNDVSAQGIGIKTKKRLSRKDKVVLTIDLPDGLEPFRIQGEVVWVRRAKFNYRDLGIKLEDVHLTKMHRIIKLVTNG